MFDWLKSINLGQWLIFVSIILGLIIVILTILLIFFKKTGRENAAKQVEKILFFVKTIHDLVLSAETHENWSGQERRDYVIAKAESEFSKKGYKYTDEEIVKEIDNNMETGNGVNRRGTVSRTH